MKIGVLRDKKEVTILTTSYLSIVVNVELIAQVVIITLLKSDYKPDLDKKPKNKKQRLLIGFNFLKNQVFEQ